LIGRAGQGGEFFPFPPTKVSDVSAKVPDVSVKAADESANIFFTKTESGVMMTHH
jgi:hypothetical protein